MYYWWFATHLERFNRKVVATILNNANERSHLENAKQDDNDVIRELRVSFGIPFISLLQYNNLFFFI